MRLNALNANVAKRRLAPHLLAWRVPMRAWTIGLLLGFSIATAACNKGQPEQKAGPITRQDIAWREGDVDDAFTEARETGKPVLLYWGAKWCPPCNQLKTTLFKDPEFITETRLFVPVYLDGDSKGAQAWGERFNITGYPSVIILRPDHSEITRLSSASAATALADTLRIAAKRTKSSDLLLKTARQDPARLSPEDWRLLANFEWQNDPRHFADPATAAPILDRLAAVAPDPALKRRFTLLALSVASKPDGSGKAMLSPADQQRLTTILPPILASYAEVKANRQELSFLTAPLIAGIADPAQRDALGAQLIAALDHVYADSSLPLPDRLATVQAEIDLGKAKTGAVPSSVLAKVRERAAWADRTAKDPAVRQSLISNAGDLLDAAGDNAGARKLLEAEIPRAASPFYYMLDLAGLAEDGGDKKAAITWSQRAYEAAQGPATRIQWAIAWSNTILRLAPSDKAEIERSANAVITELGKSPDSYYQRTRIKIAAWGKALKAWSNQHQGDAVLQHIEQKMATVCATQGAAQTSCKGWLQTA
jgi:protein disulfide-isomerase